MEITALSKIMLWAPIPITGRLVLLLLVVLAIVEIAAFVMRPPRTTKPREIFSMIAIGFCASTWLFNLWEGTTDPMLPSWTGVLGVILFACGIALRTVAFWQLGKFYDPAVTIHHDHRLVQTGLYRFMRHPLYVGSLLLFLGFSLAFSSGIGLVVFCILVIPIFLWRVHIEERELHTYFGNTWTAYAQKTRRWGLF